MANVTAAPFQLPKIVSSIGKLSTKKDLRILFCSNFSLSDLKKDAAEKFQGSSYAKANHPQLGKICFVFFFTNFVPPVLGMLHKKYV